MTRSSALPATILAMGVVVSARAARAARAPRRGNGTRTIIIILALLAVRSVARSCKPAELDTAAVAGKPPCTVAMLSRRQAELSASEEERLTALLKRHASLHTLRLDYNRIRVAGAARVGTVLAGAAARGGILVVNLAHNQLGDDGARALGKALRAGVADGAALEELYLGHNAIGDEGIAALVAALGTSPSARTLRRLDFSYNHVGDGGAAALAAALVVPEAAGSMLGPLLGLEMVGLGNNQIGRAGAAAVASAIVQRGCDLDAATIKVRSVTLDYNELGDAGAAAFVPMLSAGGFGVRTLGLSGNEISDNQAVALARALQHGKPTARGLCGGSAHTLENLMLAHNPLGDVGAAALADAAEAANSALGMVVLVACRLSSAAVGKRLRDALRSGNRDNERRSDARSKELLADFGMRRQHAMQQWAKRAERATTAETCSGGSGNGSSGAQSCSNEEEAEPQNRAPQTEAESEQVVVRIAKGEAV